MKSLGLNPNLYNTLGLIQNHMESYIIFLYVSDKIKLATHVIIWFLNLKEFCEYLSKKYIIYLYLYS